jgi:hypothetical protein
MQLFQPERNSTDIVSKTDIANLYEIPDSVNALLANACYDCHSNNTEYPWFTNIQPIGWILQSKIDEGKQHLNFSTFGDYPDSIAVKVLDKLKEEVEHKEMPIDMYKWVNNSADLTDADRKMITTWAQSLQMTILQKLAPVIDTTKPKTTYYTN